MFGNGHARQRVGVIVLCLLLAGAFLGARGIWDPDEGRYSNVAVTMLDNGNWVDTMRSDQVGHWTKPPLTYWAIAASVSTLGHNAFAARLPMALSYLACIGLAGLCARRLRPGSGTLAALAYATMALPFGTSQWISTDAPLAACQALAMWGYVEYRFGSGRAPGRWLALTGAALGLAFLTKGPPALVVLPVMLLLGWLAPPARPAGPAPRVLAVFLFAAIALPWFIVVAARHPGLLHYLLGAEVVDRMTTDRFARFGSWWGWVIYVPTLLLGTLPWTGSLLRAGARLPAACRRWRDRATRQREAPALLLALWVAVPLLVFCLARSRLPLYVLPVFLPLAIIVARVRAQRGLGLPRWHWLLLWVALLLGLRVASAHWTTHKDASHWAKAIRQRAGDRVSEVVFVEDMARYGLHLHLGVEVEKVSLAEREEPPYNPEFDESLTRELADVATEPDILFITPTAQWPAVRAHAQALGYDLQVLGTPYRDRIFFRVRCAQLTRCGAGAAPAGRR